MSYVIFWESCHTAGQEVHFQITDLMVDELT